MISISGAAPAATSSPAQLYYRTFGPFNHRGDGAHYRVPTVANGFRTSYLGKVEFEPGILVNWAYNGYGEVANSERVGGGPETTA